MTRSARTRGIAAALFVALLGAPMAHAQSAPAANPVASVQFVAAAAVGVSQAAQLATPGQLPSTFAQPAQRPDSPNVFGTVSMPLKMLPAGVRWGKLMNAPLDGPALTRLAADASGLDRDQQVAFVQSAVSRSVRNAAPSGECSDDGYWASANETLTRGMGDCVDIAVAKMEALRSLGVAERDLYLTKGHVGGKGREATALLVRSGDDFWLLPPDGAQPIRAGSDGASATFDPIVTYGLGTNWLHGRRTSPAAAQ